MISDEIFVFLASNSSLKCIKVILNFSTLKNQPWTTFIVIHHPLRVLVLFEEWKIDDDSAKSSKSGMMQCTSLALCSKLQSIRSNFPLKQQDTGSQSGHRISSNPTFNMSIFLKNEIILFFFLFLFVHKRE